MSKNIWIIANWKSNKTIAEALDWISRVGPETPRSENLKVVVCPIFTDISEVAKEIQVNGYPILVGSQDLSPFPVGAYTGEEAGNLLKDLVKLSILGHSERRENFLETDEMVEKKVTQATKNNIISLVCVQNTQVPVPEGCKLVAYEPTWAIGSGTADTPENANKISQNLRQLYGEDLEVLYGGSVTSQNIEGFLKQDNINGALIGGASLDPEEFLKIIKIAANLS